MGTQLVHMHPAHYPLLSHQKSTCAFYLNDTLYDGKYEVISATLLRPVRCLWWPYVCVTSHSNEHCDGDPHCREPAAAVCEEENLIWPC